MLLAVQGSQTERTLRKLPERSRSPMVTLVGVGSSSVPPWRRTPMSPTKSRNRLQMELISPRRPSLAHRNWPARKRHLSSVSPYLFRMVQSKECCATPMTRERIGGSQHLGRVSYHHVIYKLRRPSPPWAVGT